MVTLEASVGEAVSRGKIDFEIDRNDSDKAEIRIALENGRVIEVPLQRSGKAKYQGVNGDEIVVVHPRSSLVKVFNPNWQEVGRRNYATLYGKPR